MLPEPLLPFESRLSLTCADEGRLPTDEELWWALLWRHLRAAPGGADPGGPDREVRRLLSEITDAAERTGGEFGPRALALCDELAAHLGMEPRPA